VFIAISVVDTAALLEQFEWFMKTIGHFKPLKFYFVGCKIMYWIPTMSQICSSCLVLLFTIERFISVRFPLKRAFICTKRRINSAIVGIVVVAAVATVYELYYNVLVTQLRKIACILTRFGRPRYWVIANGSSAFPSVRLSVTLVSHT